MLKRFMKQLNRDIVALGLYQTLPAIPAIVNKQSHLLGTNISVLHLIH